jgi:uncharacterized protein DUF4136
MNRGFLTRGPVVAAFVVAGLSLGPRSAMAQDVSVDYDRHADFSRCTTYAWAPGHPAQSPLVDGHIVEAIDGALVRRGWRKVQENASCLVSYHASAREQRSLQVWDGGRRFAGGMGSVDVRTIVNGMLVVDIADAASRQLIWRAVARDTVSEKAEKNEKKLGKCVEKMFAAFPPPSGEK